MNTRVKVPRLLLIERIKDAIKEETAKHEAEMKVYVEKVSKIAPAVLKEITELSTKVSAMTTDELTQFISEKADRYSRFSIESSIKMPSRPHPYNSDYDERMLRILEASADEFISVSTRDGLYQYL